MTTGQKQQLLVTLQENVSVFFDKFYKIHGTQMQCAMGCAKCCRVELNVFPIEAQRIFDWWREFENSERKGILESWLLQSSASISEPVCPFLVEKKCSIYSARPIICRSQGLPLKVMSDRSKDEDEAIVELSLCELNFTEEESLPPIEKWLDLERLNTLLVIAQQRTPADEISNEISNITSDEDGRVPLSRLKSLLLQSAD